MTGRRRLQNKKGFLRRIDYRHYICGAITIGVMLLCLRFPNALGRVIESVRDIGLSVAYNVCECFGIEHNITPTVTELPKIPFFDFSQPSTPSIPSMPVPSTWELFKEKWVAYWQLWASKRNFLNYLFFLFDILYIVCQVLLIAIPLIFVLYLLLQRYLRTENNDHDKDSPCLCVYKWVIFHIYLPVKMWIYNFIHFVKKNPLYWQIWVFAFSFYFNVITIFLEFLAFYLYFCISFDIVGIYRQVYKLCIDLSVPFGFIPLLGWIIVAMVAFNYFRKKKGYDRLNHNEMKNRGFINARPIVSMIVATMGKGKTTMMTCQGLSNVVMFRDKAFEKILENDLKFPKFPWINLEKSIQRAMDSHLVYNLATTRKFIQRRKTYFYNHPSRRNCFNYDFEHYGLTYDDKLKIVDVWDILEIYAQLYFIYVIQSATMLANYSVRLDDIMSDMGNFPMWNSDFFKRDSRLIDSFSRHSKILDFNALRLGFKLGTNRKYADSFEFGTILITEIGKERGNKIENAEKKKASYETNQKNDGFNSWLKMIRHSATVDGYPFVRVITDEQRPESWGADARDLCEIIHIREKEDERLAMPFFALEELLYHFVFNKFAGLYYQYRYLRSDNTLPMYLLKAFTAKIQNYYTSIYNTFGYHVLQVEVERGTQDGSLIAAKYYISNKKVYSKRFSTDCFSDYFTVKALRSPVGLDDMPEYKTERATFEELNQQNSYFVNDLLNGMNSDE